VNAYRYAPDDAKTRLCVCIEPEFGCKIGAEEIALLEAIRTQGSITGAAGFLGLSYRATRKLVDAINKALHEPAVNTQSSVLKGGGAVLTPVGTELVGYYRAIEARTQAVAAAECQALHRLTRPKNIRPQN
jgi:molybdate transport system regulatory protein